MASLESIEVYMARGQAAPLPSNILNFHIYEIADYTDSPNTGTLLGTYAFDVANLVTQHPVFQWYTMTFAPAIELSGTGYLGVQIDWTSTPFAGSVVLAMYSDDWVDPPPTGAGTEQWYFNSGLNNGKGIMYKLNADTGVLNQAIATTALFHNWSIATGWSGMRSYVAVPVLPEKAINPDYADGDNSVPNGLDPGALYWEDGTGGEPATSYDVYFGTDFGFPGTALKVATDVPAGSEAWSIPEDIHKQLGDIPVQWLNAAQGYKWRVDSKNAAGTTTGDTWEFTTTATLRLGGARNPTPITTATGQSVTINSFTWEGCEGSTTNTVYMGQVSGQLTKQFTLSGSRLANAVNPSSYKFPYGGTTYWRVDTSRAGAGGTPLTVTGNEWSMSFLTLGNGDGTGIIVTPAGPWGAGGAPTRRLAVGLTNKGIWYEDLL